LEILIWELVVDFWGLDLGFLAPPNPATSRQPAPFVLVFWPGAWYLPAACFFVLLFVKSSAFWRGFEGKIQGFAPIPLAVMNKSAV
jgi:hypothetical protein